MAVAFGSQSTVAYASHANPVVTAPTGITNGDLLVIFTVIGAASPPTPSPPAGFTALTNFPTTVTLGGFTVKTYCWSKIAASESGNYTITHTTASSGIFMGRYTGVDQATPISPNPTTNTGTGTTSTALSITPTVNGSMILWMGHDWGDTSNTLSPPTGTTPTFTKRFQGVIIFVADGVLTTAGATGNKSITNNSSAGNPWTASMVSLQAASTGTTTHMLASTGVGV